MKRIVVGLMVLLFVVVSFGCPLADRYRDLRSDYVALREGVRAKCAAGELTTATCEHLKKVDQDLQAVNAVVVKGEATRKQIKEALQDLTLTVEEQKMALEGTHPAE